MLLYKSYGRYAKIIFCILITREFFILYAFTFEASRLKRFFVYETWQLNNAEIE